MSAKLEFDKMFIGPWKNKKDERKFETKTVICCGMEVEVRCNPFMPDNVIAFDSKDTIQLFNIETGEFSTISKPISIEEVQRLSIENYLNKK